MEFPLDHVAIAVPSITAVLPLFESLSGSSGSPVEAVAGQNVNATFVGSGDARIELIEPTTANSTIQKFLDRRGSGLHHLAYRVPDLRAALERCSAAGIQLIDSVPRQGAGGHRVAFLHPSSTSGILIELVEG
ncbi:MAG: methylmalonyl-CoA epimerase [Longimicrobiales bacterium]